jgi:hypothetical protein
VVPTASHRSCATRSDKEMAEIRRGCKRGAHTPPQSANAAVCTTFPNSHMHAAGKVRGHTCVTTIRQVDDSAGSASSICGTCVDFPQPVSPAITTTRLFLTQCMTSACTSQMGSWARSFRRLVYSAVTTGAHDDAGTAARKNDGPWWRCPAGMTLRNRQQSRVTQHVDNERY